MAEVNLVHGIRSRLSQTPVMRVVIIAVVIAISEILIMGVLDLMKVQTGVISILADTLLLLIILTPLLYLGVLLPMDKYIADCRKAQAALAESEAHFRILTNSGEAIIWMTKPDKKCNYLNQICLDFTGRPLEDQLDDGWTFGVHPDDRPYCLKTFNDAFDNRVKFTMKYRLLHHSGEYRWILANGSPSYNHKGEFIGYIGHCFDIHEQKLAEENIKKREKDYWILFEYSPMPAFFWNLEGTILFWNKAAEKTFGWTKEEVTGQNLTLFFKPNLKHPEINYNLEEALKSVGDKPNVSEIRRKDGQVILCEGHRSRIYGLDGKIVKIISVVKDITEQKRFEQELIGAKEKAEESERLKSAFLANMSHELRSPLNSIIGFSELLSDPDFNTEQKQQFAQLINKGGRNLLETITELMDFSKIDAGQVKVNKHSVSLIDLLNDLHLEYSYKATEKGIDLLLDIDHTHQKVIVESDEIKLRQVLVNLISNALKFTGNGSIELGLKAADDYVQFHVRDTGIGIPPEYRDKIFERFLQVESYHQRKYGGIGLGLAISKSLVEMLGGRIWVESHEGQGSTFYFKVPVRSV